MHMGETDTKFIVKQLSEARLKVNEVLDLLERKNPFGDSIADELELMFLRESLDKEIEFWKENTTIYTG